MEKIKRAASTLLATVSTPAGSSAHAYLMVLAVRNTVGKHPTESNFPLIHCTGTMMFFLVKSISTTDTYKRCPVSLSLWEFVMCTFRD